MARSETFKLRLTTEELAGYHAGAAQLGMDLSSWIGLKCSQEPEPLLLLVDGDKPAAKVNASVRRTMCEHRRRPDQFCNRCD